jgi:hypothetical protein
MRFAEGRGLLAVGVHLWSERVRHPWRWRDHAPAGGWRGWPHPREPHRPEDEPHRVEGLLAVGALIVSLYHVNDPFGAIGIYLTLLASLVWIAALAWWWLETRGQVQASESAPTDQGLRSPLEPPPPAEEVTESEGGGTGPRPSQ